MSSCNTKATAQASAQGLTQGWSIIYLTHGTTVPVEERGRTGFFRRKRHEAAKLIVLQFYKRKGDFNLFVLQYSTSESDEQA